MNDREKAAGTVPVATSSTERREVVVARSLGGRQVRTAFNYDCVLGSFSTQEDVFNVTVKPLIQQVLSGFDATAFAYGQTGTGKTYTMEGDPEACDGAGLMPRAATAVLSALTDPKYLEHTVTMSYLEIYNEELSDLLAPANQQQKLELMDTGSSRGVCCVGLSEVPVKTFSDISELVKAAQERRRMAETRMNARSSRSHCIFTMKVRCRKQVTSGELETVGKLHLVDLAGSECAKKAAFGAEDIGQRNGAVEQERERRNINQSLLTLGRVIGALRENSHRVPYRDSKLTRLLQDALGGNCKTVLIATISPALAAVEETISTLTYAEQANGIQNKPVATSFLRLARGDSRSSSDLGSSSLTGMGSMDWAEVEMKIMYLTQEVEEAQSALARKYLEMQEFQERAETAEQAAEAAKAQVAQIQEALCSSATTHSDTATSARSLVANLQGALAASTAARQDEEKRLSELRGQRYIEEQMIAMLQQQRQDLHNDVVGVQKELDVSKTELVSTKRDIQELQKTQEKRFEETMQAIVKLTTEELTKMGRGFTEGAEKACERVDGVCNRLESTSSLASAAAARSADAGQKAAQAMTSYCQELSSKYESCHQRSAEARRALETTTRHGGDQLASSAEVSESAATAAAKAAGNENVEHGDLKENQGTIAGKAISEKKAEVALQSQRGALKVVNA